MGIISEYYSKVERELYGKRAAEVIGISANALLEDIEKRHKSKMREAGREQSRVAAAELRQFSNRVNPDAAKNLRASYAEETLLGLLMIYPEYRDFVQSGRVELGESDFFTAFGKRVFTAIMNLHADGYVYSLLGEEFNPDEMAALEDMQRRRRALSENGIEIFESTVATLRSETQKAAVESGGAKPTLEDTLAAKRRKLEEERRRRGGNT